MNIKCTFRHMDRSVAIENHVFKELERVKRFFSDGENVTIDVVLDAARVHHHHKVEMRLRDAKGAHLIATHEGPDLYQEIEHAAKSIIREAKKHKEKLLDKRDHPKTPKDLFLEGELPDDDVAE